MFGKKDKPIAVRKFSLAEFENLYKKIKEYLESGDDAYPVDESVEISIYSNNKITISADFKSYHIEDITLWTAARKNACFESVYLYCQTHTLLSNKIELSK